MHLPEKRMIGTENQRDGFAISEWSKARGLAEGIIGSA